MSHFEENLIHCGLRIGIMLKVFSLTHLKWPRIESGVWNINHKIDFLHRTGTLEL